MCAILMLCIDVMERERDRGTCVIMPSKFILLFGLYLMSFYISNHIYYSLVPCS